MELAVPRWMCYIFQSGAGGFQKLTFDVSGAYWPPPLSSRTNICCSFRVGFGLQVFHSHPRPNLPNYIPQQRPQAHFPKPVKHKHRFIGQSIQKLQQQKDQQENHQEQDNRQQQENQQEQESQQEPENQQEQRTSKNQRTNVNSRTIKDRRTSRNKETGTTKGPRAERGR
ncbi:hypothetical protein WMY93_009105 [Mugilogobius chulae]|uniref:Uncharacterized protein n=1 Tax=Mugilogobius chulae TaxID=88201 RepID=A0AAW0PAL3_9GOBI